MCGGITYNLSCIPQNQLVKYLVLTKHNRQLVEV